jgi:hypothetical protein
VSGFCVSSSHATIDNTAMRETPNHSTLRNMAGIVSQLANRGKTRVVTALVQRNRRQ